MRIINTILGVALITFLAACPVVRGTGNAIEATGEGIGHAVEGTGHAIGETGRELAH